MMARLTGQRLRRPDMKRAIVVLPNGFTLANLFCGIFAIVTASRADTPQEYGTAAMLILLGGIADALDGRVARATNSGSAFGSELDSLVDAISFGLAPALIVYFASLNREGWDWVWVFLYTTCAVSRLARFNIQQAGKAKTHFVGLPSPAAGITLATYYLFSQTTLYNDSVIFFTDSKTLADLPWHRLMQWVMATVAFLMVSNVSYPTVPPIGYRTPRQILGSVIVLGSILALIFIPKQFFFPACVIYIAYGLVVDVFRGLVDRRSHDEPVVVDRRSPAASATPVSASAVAPSYPAVGGYDEDLDVADEEDDAADDTSVAPAAGGAPGADGQSQRKRRRRRRRPRTDRQNPDAKREPGANKPMVEEDGE